MPRSRLLPLLVACFVVAFGAAPGHAQPRSDTLSAPDATVYVDGLACPFCAYGLEKKLDTLDALQAMEVQIEKGRALLAFDGGASTSPTSAATGFRRSVVRLDEWIVLTHHPDGSRDRPIHVSSPPNVGGTPKPERTR